MTLFNSSATFLSDDLRLSVRIGEEHTVICQEREMILLSTVTLAQERLTHLCDFLEPFHITKRFATVGTYDSVHHVRLLSKSKAILEFEIDD